MLTGRKRPPREEGGRKEREREGGEMGGSKQERTIEGKVVTFLSFIHSNLSLLLEKTENG